MLLGVDQSRLEQMVEQGNRIGPLVPASAEPAIDGKTVCFTGGCTCTINADKLTRDLAHQLAESVGLKPVKNVSAKLDILVVADPHSLSGKAAKARDLGTRIMAERAFWPAAGIEVD